jgi:predicted lipid-binding transport protein (Tim44 family)
MTPTRKRRLLVILALVAFAVAILAAAPAAMAAAGGGTSGFGGGGGEGGGGRGAGLYILIQILVRIAILGHGLGALVLIGLALAWFIFTRLTPAAKARYADGGGRSQRRRTARRQRRVEAAAAEAAEDDPAFASDRVKPAAGRLFMDIQRAWDNADRATLRRLVAPELLTEWERRLDDFEFRGWRNRVKPLDQPRIEYVGINHRGGAGDTVTVRVEAKLEDYVVDRSGRHLTRRGHLGETTKVREFWTLARRGQHWMLVSIEQGAEGAHALEEQIVATPWSDDQGLRDEALVEQAQADAAPPSVNPAELTSVDFDGDAHAQALDLSLADGRFAPDVLEVAARRAAEAWAQAVDGDDAPLHAIADPLAARELLHPGDPSGKTRLVVRGPQVNRIRITHLDTSSSLPTMTVEVDLTGRRYVEDRDTTAVLAGSRRRSTSFTERWTFALNGDGKQPWRIVAVDAPVGLA